MKRAIALVCCLFAITVIAFPAVSIRAESGYDPNDVMILRTFLEQEDPNGIKNGAKLNPDYDPEDPSTWTGSFYDEWEDLYQGVNWDDNGRARAFYADSFVCEGELFGNLDFSGMSFLERVTICGASIESAVFSGCESLKIIDLYLPNSLALKMIELGNLPVLERLMLNYNELNSIDVSECPKLRYLFIEENNISTLDLSGNHELWMLMCGGNALTEIDVSHNPGLEELHCDNNMLSTLDISNCPELKNLQFNGNNIHEIDVSGLSMLWALGCAGNGITELDVSNCPDLQFLQCHDNEIRSLNLRNNCVLGELYCYNNMLEELILPDECSIYYLLMGNNRISDLEFQKLGSLSVFDGGENVFETASIALESFGGFRLFNDPLKELELTCGNITVRLSVEGCGSFGVFSYYGFDEGFCFTDPFTMDGFACGEIDGFMLIADPKEGEEFLGWFDYQGELVSSEPQLIAADGEHNLQARFTEHSDPTPTPDPTSAPSPTSTPEPSPTPIPEPTSSPEPEPTDPATPPATGGGSYVMAGILLFLTGACFTAAVRKNET